MATIDLATRLGSGLHPSVHGQRFVTHYAEKVIDFAVALTTKGSALAAADVIEAVDVPVQSVVLVAGVEVIDAVDATTLTVDVGTGVDADGFVDGFDVQGASEGDFSQNAAAYQPITVGNTADTVDVTLATLTGTLSSGKIRVWVIYGDVDDQRAPGIAAPKS